jgi:hypothetical protein
LRFAHATSRGFEITLREELFSLLCIFIFYIKLAIYLLLFLYYLLYGTHFSVAFKVTQLKKMTVRGAESQVTAVQAKTKY